ncbi:hypothetical protein FPOAC1_005053 [Fusarium poae]|jgi:hypothetical protein|uniref:hypothetical protein n=1 Tax=Fusarium poae TaxID=36050 RepID=UPI001CEA1E12|nr:hypothetical protein FPOAC1_005053 [Fusarium poae]KAG8671795.1 hypothetical protein FPOAC1_005053 [Fusarium poae]
MYACTALRRALCGHPSGIHAGPLLLAELPYRQGKGPTAWGWFNAKKVHKTLCTGHTTSHLCLAPKSLSRCFWLQRHNIDSNTGSVWHNRLYFPSLDAVPLKRVPGVELANVKVASWPQIIIDIGHSIYMIGSVCNSHQTERLQTFPLQGRPPLRFGPFNVLVRVGVGVI